MKTPSSAKGTIMRDDRIDESSGRTPAQLEERARELAQIRGLEEGYEAEDMRAARREILGEHLPTQVDDDTQAHLALIRDPSEPPADGGHQVEDVPATDEQADAESLALEGVDAAERERMLAARRDPKL